MCVRVCMYHVRVSLSARARGVDMRVSVLRAHECEVRVCLYGVRVGSECACFGHVTNFKSADLCDGSQYI